MIWRENCRVLKNLGEFSFPPGSWEGREGCSENITKGYGRISGAENYGGRLNAGCINQSSNKDREENKYFKRSNSRGRTTGEKE